MRKLLSIPILCVFCVLCGCKENPVATEKIKGDTTPVVATVGSKPVTMRMLQRIAAQNGYDLREEKGRELAFRDAVNFELLAMEAEKRGYREHPDIEHYVKTQSVQRLLADTVDAGATRPEAPSEEALKDYYEEHLAEFTPPTMARARVLGLLKRQGQEAAFEQKLDAVKTAITAKAVPFGEMVAQFSDDPAAKAYGGMTQWLVRGQENKRYPQALIDAVFAASDPKEIHGPIEHNDWVYFVKLEEKRGGEAAAFEQSKARIAKQMERQQRLEAYDAFVAGLKSDELKVETFPDKVEAALEAKQEGGGPPAGPVSVKE